VYSFEEKYIKRQSDGVRGKGQNSVKGAPMSVLNKELRDKIRAYTKTIYKRMNLKGIVRMDFLVAENKVYLCEVNTVPGSLAYYMFCERISDAKRLFTAVIEDAVASFIDGRKGLITTGILDGVPIKRK
jgi:D-alanine-D-alanine ligase